MVEQPPVLISERPLAPVDVVAVARWSASVQIDPALTTTMAQARGGLEELIAGDVALRGVTTGIGPLAGVHVAHGLRARLQRSLLRSHAASMGEPLERDQVRAMMLLRCRALSTGYPAVRPAVPELLAGMLNAGITPVIKRHGSVGGSGDQVPLAQLGLVMMGEGEAAGPEGTVRDSTLLLEEFALHPIAFEAKEAQALISGTEGALGQLVLGCADMGSLLSVADIAVAMSVEGLLASVDAFDEQVIALRPHPGALASAANLRRLLRGSAMVTGESAQLRPADALSLRAAPQIHGAARDALGFARRVAELELGSVIDDPVLLPDGRVLATGSIHGAPLSMVCDLLATQAASVGTASERRTARLLDPTSNLGLPPFLADDPGVDSGLLAANATQSALAAENRRLAVPAGVDPAPVTGGLDDVGSQSWSAANKLLVVLDNLANILAVELVAGARAQELRAPLRAAAGTRVVLASLRAVVDGPGPDRYLARDLAGAYDLIRSGAILEAARLAVSSLD